MQECEADLMCKGFVTFDLQSVCYFKQDLPTPGGLLAAMVSARDCDGVGERGGM